MLDIHPLDSKFSVDKANQGNVQWGVADCTSRNVEKKPDQMWNIDTGATPNVSYLLFLASWDI